MLLATQNPVDLDYKALGNTGTWFLGRYRPSATKRVCSMGSWGSPVDSTIVDRVLSALKKHFPHAQRARDRAGRVRDAMDAFLPPRAVVP